MATPSSTEVPKPPTEKLLPPDKAHTGKVRKGAPRLIVLHATGGVDSRAWLTRTSPPGKEVSIHVLIDKTGLVYRSTPDEREAWHGGHGYLGIWKPFGPNGSINSVSLGLELENLNNGKDPYPEVQVDACGFVIAGWWKKYGVLPVLSHAILDGRKHDPLQFDWAHLYQAIYRWWL